MSTQRPQRGEIGRADLNPTRGHEQSGIRPVLIVSDDALNKSPAELVIALPLTSKSKNVRTHVPVEPPEGGLTMRSYIKCEEVRSIATERLQGRIGQVEDSTMQEVEYRLRILLHL